jgi:hypothetical protein
MKIGSLDLLVVSFEVLGLLRYQLQVLLHAIEVVKSISEEVKVVLNIAYEVSFYCFQVPA